MIEISNTIREQILRLLSRALVDDREKRRQATNIANYLRNRTDVQRIRFSVGNISDFINSQI